VKEEEARTSALNGGQAMLARKRKKKKILTKSVKK
jgi:hypothetical protein